MRNISSKYLVVMLSFMIAAAPAKAFMGVGDVVTDPGLTMETVRASAAQAAAEAAKIANQITQIQQAATNTLRLADPVFKPVGDAMRSLQQAYMQGQSLMWRAQNIDQQFGAMYPSYYTYLGSTGSGGQTMSGLYRQWSDQNNQNVRSAMNAAGIQTNGLADEQAMLVKLMEQANSTTGQKQAIEAAAQIAADQSLQMLKLRSMMAENMTMHANHIAAINARQSAFDARLVNFQTPRPMNSKGMGF